MRTVISIRHLRAALLFWAATSSPLWAECQLAKLPGIEPVFGAEHIYLPAKVNGKPVLFIVDTSADTLLFEDASKAAGVRFTTNASKAAYSLNGDPMMDSKIVLDTLEIGLWKSANVPLHAAGPVAESAVDGVPVIGLAGEDLLSHFDVEISFKDKLFALYQPQGCESASLAYWTKDYNVADMVNFKEQSPRVKVQAKLDGKPIDTLIDTGTPYTLISQDVAAAYDVTPDSPDTAPAGMVRGVLGQPAKSWIGSFKSFELDQEKIAPAKIDFFRFNRRDFNGTSRTQQQSSLPFQILLGIDFLRAHHVLISHSQRKVYFSYAGGRPFSAPKPDDPLSDPTK